MGGQLVRNSSGKRATRDSGNKLTRVAVVGDFGVLDGLLVVVEHKVVVRAADRGTESQINGTLALSIVALAAPFFGFCTSIRVIK